jgi:hypothetical protein
MIKKVGKLIGNYLYRKFKRYAIWPTWRLIFTSIFFLAAGLLFLRQNNITALEGYHQVIKADQNGGSVYEKLDQLQKFTFGHLNSNIGQPVQLVNTYNRDAQKVFEEAQARLDAQDGSDSQRDVYLEAQKACEARGIPIAARAQCAADYALANNPGIESSKLEVKLPDRSLYSFQFSSPRWAWDGAGISILLSAVFFVGAMFRMTLAWYLRKRWVSWDDKYLR